MKILLVVLISIMNLKILPVMMISFIRVSTILENLLHKICRASNDLIKGLKLNEIISKRLDKAINRAKENGRIIVESFDI